MMITIKAFSKQFFGAKFESIGKSIMASVILFVAIYVSEFQIKISPFILYLTSTCYTAGVTWQMLTSKHHMDVMQGMFMLPFENRSFVLSYVSVLGAYTLITKTLPIWSLFFAVTSWSIWEIILGMFCGCMACVVTASVYRMNSKHQILLPILWSASILAMILLVRQWIAVLTIVTVNFCGAVLYLTFVNAYDFYNVSVAKKVDQHAGHTGRVFVYLIRYLLANKSYLINTVGLCAISSFLPLLFRELPGLNLFPIGLSLLCLNTPICTLLSSDSDLEQAIRVLPGQTGRFCRKYCFFIFIVNEMIAGIYLCSWQIIYGGVGFVHVGMLILFSLQSAIFSVILEWKYPIRGWKTESDLWHHPRKYIVPLAMLLLAIFICLYMSVVLVWSVVLLIECCVLLYLTKQEKI